MKEMTEMWGGGWKNGASRCQVSEKVVLKIREWKCKWENVQGFGMSDQTGKEER